MTPERLAEIKRHAEAARCLPQSTPWSVVTELLAEVERVSAERDVWMRRATVAETDAAAGRTLANDVRIHASEPWAEDALREYRTVTSRPDDGSAVPS